MSDEKQITLDTIKVMIQECLNDKVVYRDYCRERHKEVDYLRERIEMLEERWNKIFLLLIATLTSVVTNLVVLLLK